MGMLSIKYPETISCEAVGHVFTYSELTDDTQEIAAIVCFKTSDGETGNHIDCCEFIQTEELTELGIAVHPYGAIVYTVDENENEGAYLDLMYKGKLYRSNIKFFPVNPCNIDVYTFTPVEPVGPIPPNPIG